MPRLVSVPLIIRLACLLSCFAALIGVAQASDGSAATKDDAPAFSLVTLNLYHDKDNWPKRREMIVQALRTLRPDAIALQEVIQNEHTPNQAQWLAEQLGYQWHFVTTDAADKPLRYGNALLTRHPILERGEALLRPLDDHRTVGRLRLDWNGQPLNLYATHLHWTEDGGELRREQIGHLLEYLHTTAGEAPSIVAGDLNTIADAPELAALRAGFQDSYGSLQDDADSAADSTLDLRRYPPKRIDHVFFQRDRFVPVAADIILRQPDADGLQASDHYGLHALLRMSPTPSPRVQSPSR